ncbi:MAG: NUDIX domain-containing protein [Candidatus Nitrosopolaris sp.]
MFNRITVCDTAIVIPLFKDGSLLMVENYRHGVGTDLLELPGGFINEVPLGAARRELIEETGYTCDRGSSKLVLHMAWEDRTEEFCCRSYWFKETFQKKSR